MSSPFRKKHLLYLIESFNAQQLPLDVYLRIYFKKNRSIGAHDRKYLAETIYTLIRWRGLIDYLVQETPSWEQKITIAENLSPNLYLENEQIPLHTRLSFPIEYFSYLLEELGKEGTRKFCLESNYPAPTTIRSNPIKISREDLLHRFQSSFSCTAGDKSPYAIHFSQRAPFFTLPEFKEGFFEMQDEGSQLVAMQVEALPGEHVLDYCSGAGGKTLAIAPLLQGKGQLYLHDIRNQALIEAKKRLKRAGIQNAQFIPADNPQKKRMTGKMDWVLVDAPCSGSGTLRRNPDMKWKFKRSDIEELTEKQRKIFKEALAFVKPKGFIVYATCSVLPAENEQQVRFFQEQFSIKLVKPPFSSFPARGSMDGFFSATFQKA